MIKQKMQIQKPIDVLTVQELCDKLTRLIEEGKGDNFILLPVLGEDYETDYVFASGERSFELKDSLGKVVYLEALSVEEDIEAAHILQL